MEEPGLAMSGADDQLLQEVVQLLLQGTDPQELLENGVPEDILQQAIEIVLAQTGGGQPPAAPAGPPVTDGGLAATGML